MAQRKRLGLALGGGGARGLASIGVLRVLDNAGIKVSAIAGTSMGGLIGALYAAGLPLDRVAQLSNYGGPKELARHLFDLTVSPRGFLRGERMRAGFAEALGQTKRFADLRIPLAVVAADLRSGREVVLDSGPLVDALRATCSVPGVFLPVDYKDTTLVDGGILNNVPTDVVREMDVDVVLAVNVLPDFSRNEAGQVPLIRGLRQRKIPAAIREQLHTQMIMISALTKQRLETSPPDVLLAPEISEQVGLFVGYDLARQTIQAGERAAGQRLVDLMALLEPRPAPDLENALRQISPNAESQRDFASRPRGTPGHNRTANR